MDEAIDVLRIPRTAVFELLKSGEITGIKIGRRRLITMASIEDLVARRVAEVAGDAEVVVNPNGGSVVSDGAA